MKEYSNATRKKLASEARKRIADDEKALVNHASSLVKETHLLLSRRRVMSCGGTQHQHSQSTHHFAFAMVSTVDSLPRNANLC